jgi:hypothetical protein
MGKSIDSAARAVELGKSIDSAARAVELGQTIDCAVRAVASCKSIELASRAVDLDDSTESAVRSSDIHKRAIMAKIDSIKNEPFTRLSSGAVVELTQIGNDNDEFIGFVSTMCDKNKHVTN